ncbi:MAG: CvpA family protein [Bacilli bacterium]|nr:CvpA family protein [Bacilli bacterium]
MNLNAYLPAAGQAITFDYISIGLLVVMLIFGIIFLCKGFLKAFFSILIAVGSIVIATLCCKPLSNFIWYNTPVGNLIYNPIFKFVSGFKDGALNVGVSTSNAATVIPQALADLGVPEFLRGALSGVISTGVNLTEEEVYLSSVLSYSIGFYALVSLVFALLSALVAITFKIILNLLLKLKKKTKTGWFDRLLGFIFGCGIGLIVISVLSYFLIFVINMENGIGDWVANQIRYNDSNTWTVAKGLMTLMNDIVSKVFK